MTDFSVDQIKQILQALERVRASMKCPVCPDGKMGIDRGQYALLEVAQLRENPTAAAGGRVGKTGKVAACVLCSCTACGYARLHTIAGLGLDNMV